MRLRSELQVWRRDKMFCSAALLLVVGEWWSEGLRGDVLRERSSLAFEGEDCI